jgi:hypothetical protein
MSLQYYEFQDAVEGAQTSIYLAVSEEVEGVSGKYFMDCKVKFVVIKMKGNYI